MKILALLGSPRPEGNTRAVLDIVLTAAREAGADTETIELAGLETLTGCRECFTCQAKRDEPGCAVQDDMQDVLSKALEADAVVWATPVFCWSPTWLTKIAMDRFYCMFKFGNGSDIKSLLRRRKMAAVISAGGGPDDGADLVEETCVRMARFANCKWVGAFLATNVESPEAIRADSDLVKRAWAYGRTLVS